MRIAGLIEEDFVNYKKPCMTVMFPYCSFKCNKESGRDICHNLHLKECDLIEIDPSDIVKRYCDNPISEAIVMQGLEPIDSFDELCTLIDRFSRRCSDDIIIYTGYKEEEITDQLIIIPKFAKTNKVVVKFGRFIPDCEPVFDETLGVKLSSSNQYAKIIS